MKNKVLAVIAASIAIALAPIGAANASTGHAKHRAVVHYSTYKTYVDDAAVANSNGQFPVDANGSNAWHHIGSSWYEYTWRAYRDLGNDVPADVAVRLAAGDDI